MSFKPSCGLVDPIADKLAVIRLTNLMPLDIGGITRSVAGFYVPALGPAK
jgi:expansin (peptidoglycan-binding protein)